MEGDDSTRILFAPQGVVKGKIDSLRDAFEGLSALKTHSQVQIPRGRVQGSIPLPDKHGGFLPNGFAGQEKVRRVAVRINGGAIYKSIREP